MADNDRRGGVYQGWNEDLRRIYIDPLKYEIQTLIEIPYYPFTITEIDVLKLRSIAKSMDVDVDGLNLFDRITFFEVRGECMKRAIEKVETHLKPTDPYAELLTKLKDYDVRQMEGEKI